MEVQERYVPKRAQPERSCAFRAPRAEQAVTGRDSLEGMTALLRRGIAEKDLVRICVEEWKKTSLNDHKSREIGLSETLIDHKNVVLAYREIAKALVEKT